MAETKSRFMIAFTLQQSHRFGSNGCGMLIIFTLLFVLVCFLRRHSLERTKDWSGSNHRKKTSCSNSCSLRSSENLWQWNEKQHKEENWQVLLALSSISKCFLSTLWLSTRQNFFMDNINWDTACASLPLNVPFHLSFNCDYAQIFW